MTSTSVSVVIPAYNCARYIGMALDSVISQSHTCQEIVVVDDGSSDDTPGVLANYAKRIRMVHQSNQGVAAARNRAIESAQCEWIAFLDSDDVWHPNKLALQLKALARFPDTALIFSDFRMVDAEGRCIEPQGIKSYYGLFRRKGVDWGDMFSARASVNGSTPVMFGNCFQWLFHGNFVKTSTVMVKREVLVAAGMFDTRWRTEEDYDLWLKIALERPMAYLDEAVVDARRRPGQLTDIGNAAAVAENATAVVLSYADQARARLGTAVVEQRLAELYRHLALVRLLGGERKLARYAAKQSLEFEPRSAQMFAISAWSYLPVAVTRAMLKCARIARQLVAFVWRP